MPSTFEYVDLESVIGTEIVSHSTETINTAPSRAQRLAKRGDIFYQTVRPYQKNNYLFEKDRGNYVFSTGYAQLRPFVNERFLFYLIQNGNFVNMVLYNCTGTSYPAINSSDLRRIDIYLSRNSTEQKCIGNTIKTLDHLITLHQSKSFEYIFKAIVNCTLYWEQRKFSDLYEKVIEKNDLSFGTDKIISVASMYYKEDTSNSDDDYMRTYNVMRLGDIAFEGNKSKNFAHGRFVENTIGDGIVSHVFDVFRPISEYDLLFWKYFINYEGVMGRIMIRCTKASTMMTNLVAKDFLEESIVVPSIVEQKRIGYYLKSLDHLITLHQLEPYKLIFKAIAYRIIDYAKSKPPRCIK